MPDINEINLAKYRIDKAKDCVKASKLLLEENMYADSANRSYYAIFHVMRAANIIKGFDSSKHSGVIAFLSVVEDYLKTENHNFLANPQISRH